MALMILPFIGALSVSHVLVAVTTACLVYLIIKNAQNKIPEGLQQLPGPKSLPIIGNLLELGKRPYLSLTSMSKRYGDVFQIQIGMRPVVVLSGNETVRQALIKQGDEFAGRPDLYSFRYINDGKEAEYLIKELNTVMKTKGSFDPFRYVVVSVANVICGMCFGRRYDHHDDELVSLVNLSDDFVKVVGSGNPADFIPLLQYLPSTKMKKFVSLNARFSKFVQKLVTEHYATFDKDNIRDITDSLIDHCEDRKLDENANIQMSDEKIVGIVNDLFGAGFDTISTALSWSLMYFVAYPEIQNRLFEEMKEKVGLDRMPVFSDRNNLPLLEAYILELFRHSSYLPFTIPHCTTKDTSLNGYFIPKDTCVFINQWQINHDPELWEDPFSFKPERFLNADGTEVNKVEGEKVMTFGLGKRRCIGEVIARNEVFLFLAILIQNLNFQALPGDQLDLTPEYGLTMKHKRYHLRATMRVKNEQ
uniref:Cytochrome P450 1A n=1 Tax=Oreochromis niloticus TaxID=8128 RepID=A0A669C2L8_ORENI